jgi:hypothetical protein
MARNSKPRSREWRGSKQKSELRMFEALVFYPRESRDSPILNAFWRVAPSVRFIVRAIFAADILFLASDFSSRTCADVHARLFDVFFAIKYLHV